jgi:hypothetical protein
MSTSRFVNGHGISPEKGAPSGTSSAGGCAPEDPDEDKRAAKPRKG